MRSSTCRQLSQGILSLKGCKISTHGFGFSRRPFADVPLVQNSSKIRAEWERIKKESDDTNATEPDVSIASRTNGFTASTVFGKSQPMKSKVGLRFIGQLQSVTKSTTTSELDSLFASISQHIDEFSPYELIDIGYFLTRINKPGCSLVVEPIFHRLFSMPERYSCLNGIYIHRLDVTYRVWIYDVAKIVGAKHRHLLMRDLQLIVDDLSLFYDAAAQGALVQFESSVIERAHQLELYRLPLIAHALGRCGYNSVNVAKAIHGAYLKKRNSPEFYSGQFVGLLLKGYASFHFHPGTEFLEDIWRHIKNDLELRFIKHVPEILDVLIAKHNLLSHLEFTDFITNCWSIQSHILEQELKPYVLPLSIWQTSGDATIDTNFKAPPADVADVSMDSADVSVDSHAPIPSCDSVEPLYRLYRRLFDLILREMPEKIYESTPPYRATQFELLTRLLDLNPNPRDFKIVLPLNKFDVTYPLIVQTSGKPNVNGITTLKDVYLTFTQFAASRYFGDAKRRSEANESGDISPLEQDKLEKYILESGDENIKLEPLHDIFKRYLHAIFFRTPALAPRGLRILIEGLVRIHFEKREDCIIDPDLLPKVKTAYYHRPLSRAIIREVYRKLACYNTDDLIVSVYGMVILRIFELDMAATLLSQLTEMWVHHKQEKQLSSGQLSLIQGFYSLLKSQHPQLYENVKFKVAEL